MTWHLMWLTGLEISQGYAFVRTFIGWKPRVETGWHPWVTK